MIKHLFKLIYSYRGSTNSFGVLISVAVTLLFWGVMRKRNPSRKGLAAACFTILYLSLVYTFTVLSRTVSAERRYCLQLFWSYSKLIQGELIYFSHIVLNIFLLLPIGFSLSYVWENKKAIILFGFSFSSLIEVSQLLTGRGLFELDDLFHNTLGVILGILIHTGIERIKQKYLGRRR